MFLILFSLLSLAATIQHYSSHRHHSASAEADAAWYRPQERVPTWTEGREEWRGEQLPQPWSSNRGKKRVQCNVMLVRLFLSPCLCKGFTNTLMVLAIIIFVQMLALLFNSFAFFRSFFCILGKECKDMEISRKLNKKFGYRDVAQLYRLNY